VSWFTFWSKTWRLIAFWTKRVIQLIDPPERENCLSMALTQHWPFRDQTQKRKDSRIGVRQSTHKVEQSRMEHTASILHSFNWSQIESA
jgi:hypothetical protein